MKKLQFIIEQAFEQRITITSHNAGTDIKNAISESLALLDNGQARIAEKINGEWIVDRKSVV